MGGQLFLFDHFLNKLTMRKELLLLPLILFCLELAAQGTEAYNKSRLLVKLKGAVPPEYFIADFSTHSRAGGGVWIGKKLSIEKNISLLLYDTAAISAEELMPREKRTLMHRIRSIMCLMSCPWRTSTADTGTPSNADAWND